MFLISLSIDHIGEESAILGISLNDVLIHVGNADFTLLF
jgi:hypothetical protein